MKTLAFLLCSVLLFAFSCDKKENICPEEFNAIPAYTRVNTGENSACSILNLERSNNVGPDINLIIQTQAELNKHILCPDWLQDIDFTKETLLAGRFIAPRKGGNIESQRVYRNCDGNITFEVILDNFGLTAITDVYYFAIIPKISTNTQVTFDVRMKD